MVSAHELTNYLAFFAGDDSLYEKHEPEGKERDKQ